MKVLSDGYICLQYVLETDPEDVEPLTWSNQNEPYMSGSGLDTMNIQCLSKVINVRNKEFALRKDSLPSADEDKEFNNHYLYQDRDTVLMDRVYGRSDAFYFMGNFGLENAVHDWSKYSPWGRLVADTHAETDNEKMELKEVKLYLGQAIVLRIKK